MDAMEDAVIATTEEAIPSSTDAAAITDQGEALAEEPSSSIGIEQEPHSQDEATEPPASEDAKRATREGILKSIFGDEEDEEDDLLVAKSHKDGDSDLEKRNKRKLSRLIKKKQEKERKKRKKKPTSDAEEEDKEKEGDTDKSKKTKHRRRLSKGEPHKKRPSKKHKTDDAAEDVPVESPLDGADDYDTGETNNHNKEEEEDPYTQAVERIKQGHKRRRSVDAHVVRDSVEEFIGRMKEAADADVASNRSGEPALAKLKLLAETTQMLRRVHYHEALLDAQVMTVLRRWLEPLPDASLPALNLRREILLSLGQLPVDKRHLQDSGIGRAVLYLWRSPKETLENKKVAQTLIEDWSRPIFDLSTNYRDVPSYESRQVSSSPKSQSAKVRTGEMDLDNDVRKVNNIKGKVSSYHARIPTPAALDYTRRPVSLSVEELKEQSKGTTNLQRASSKKFASFKAKQKKRITPTASK